MVNATLHNTQIQVENEISSQDWNELNTGASVANGFNNSTRLEGVVEEVVVVWSILVGDGFYHLLSQNTTHNCSHRGQFSKEKTEHLIWYLGGGNHKLGQC